MRGVAPDIIGKRTMSKMKVLFTKQNVIKCSEYSFSGELGSTFY